jgi:ribosomal protein S18 acetylase RimI-like enzyme
MLLRQYRGKGYGRKLWNLLVATRQIPGYQDPWSGHIRFKWEEVRKAIDLAMEKIG